MTNIDFAVSQKRLNVMLTRGKILTIVISNRTMVESKAMCSIIANGKTFSDTSRGGVALQGLFQWATVYTASDWATIFRTNSESWNFMEVNGKGIVGSEHSVNFVHLEDVSMVTDNDKMSSQIYCNRIIEEEDVGWELGCQSRTGLTQVRVIKEKWARDWAHIPVQLQIVFNQSPTMTNVGEVLSTERLDVSCLSAPSEIMDLSGVASIVQAHRQALSDADRIEARIIVVPLLPCPTNAQVVEEYTFACLETIIGAVRNSRHIQEVYVLDVPEWGAVNTWMDRRVMMSEVNASDISLDLTDKAESERFTDERF